MLQNSNKMAQDYFANFSQNRKNANKAKSYNRPSSINT